jgi:hypothetical protein
VTRRELQHFGLALAIVTMTVVMGAWAYHWPNDVEGMTNAGAFAALGAVLLLGWITRR